MIKSGLFWSRECVHNWTRKDTEKFATMDTDEYIFSYDEKNYIPFDVIERKLSENNLPEEKLNFLKGFSEKTIKNRFAI